MPAGSGTLLVVGAGPVGLTMANELARHGVRCRIVDQSPVRSETSKALGIFPRTLEAFSAMGIGDRFISSGHLLQGIMIHQQAERTLTIDFTGVDSPFPFILSLPQSETERLLTEHLATQAIEVERGLTLTRLEQANECVRATLRHADGHEETCETPWLFGCDGAHSGTRHALAMKFAGTQYDESFILADLQADPAPDRRHLHLFFSSEGILGLIPFGRDHWRVVANIQPESPGQELPELSLPDVQVLLDARGPAGIRLSAPLWISRFHISHRMVRDFRKLRVFLLGDAAHIHSPAGGQGMNTGIQDAFNLAWKVALVTKGHAHASLLASYQAEREPVARNVLNLTDRITRLATLRNPIAQGVRDLLLPVIGGAAFVSDKAAEQLSEVAISYRQSPIVENANGGRLRAGDRAPDAELRDSSGNARRLFQIFRVPRHVLLLFLGSQAGDCWSRAVALEQALDGVSSDLIDRYRIARGEGSQQADLFDLTGHAHHAFDLNAGGVILVRPDGYLAFRDRQFDPARLRSYVSRIFNLA